MVTSHLARFQLERMLSEDPQARLAPALRVHVDGCDVCRTRLRALVAARARFLNGHPVPLFAHEVLTRAELLGPYRKTPWWATPGFVRVAIAALVLGVALVGWFAHDAAASWSQSRVASFHVLAKRGEHVSRVRDGDTLLQGDRLAFEYSLARPRHFMLLGIDETGAIRRYAPTSGDLLPATPSARLPAEIELGERRGDERLYALFSSQPIEEPTARAAIARAAGAAWANGDGLTKTTRLALRAQWISVWFRTGARGTGPHALTLR